MGNLFESEKTNLIDCDYGNRIGCETFCCKLIVRLTTEEAKKIYPNSPKKISLDHDMKTGYCEFLDKKNFRCRIFEIRPQICRSYTCNGEKMLQIALREEVGSIVELCKRVERKFIAKETFQTIPKIKM